MIDLGWNGFRLEQAANELGGADACRASLTSWATRIQGVVFEPCGVLYDDSAWRRWLWQLAARMGLCCQYTPFFRVWECEFQDAVWSGETDFWQALAAFLRSAGMSRPDIDEVIAASRGKFRRFEQDTRLFPDVQWTLHQLRAGGIELAAITHQRVGETKVGERLNQVGIEKLVTRVLSRQSAEPSTRLADWQQRSLEALPGAAAGWAFVGRRQAGLSLARQMGLLTVAFNHDADADAEVYIEQFSQLAQLLDQASGRDHGYSPAKAA